jgi:hypothetical protein
MPGPKEHTFSDSRAFYIRALPMSPSWPANFRTMISRLGGLMAFQNILRKVLLSLSPGRARGHGNLLEVDAQLVRAIITPIKFPLISFAH